MTAIPTRSTASTHTSVGELISLFYEEFLAKYGDEELASVATAAVINDLLTRPGTRRAQKDEAA